MRRWLALATLWTVLGVLPGCTGTPTANQPPAPLAAPRGLAEVTPEQYAAFAPQVNRYFYHRKQAVLAGDPEIIWREYPALKTGYDRQAAINAEADVVARYRALEVIDGNISPEHDARLMLLVEGEKAVVLVNAQELYLRSNFSESGGQLQMLLYFERSRDSWTLVRTDETTLAEYHH